MLLLRYVLIQFIPYIDGRNRIIQDTSLYVVDILMYSKTILLSDFKIFTQTLLNWCLFYRFIKNWKMRLTLFSISTCFFDQRGVHLFCVSFCVAEYRHTSCHLYGQILPKPHSSTYHLYDPYHVAFQAIFSKYQRPVGILWSCFSYQHLYFHGAPLAASSPWQMEEERRKVAISQAFLMSFSPTIIW